MSLQTHFGQYLRKRRLEVQLTQDQVADRLCVSSAFLSRIEQGMTPVPKKHLLNLSLILQVVPRELLEVCATFTIRELFEGTGIDSGQWKLTYLGDSK